MFPPDDRCIHFCTRGLLFEASIPFVPPVGKGRGTRVSSSSSYSSNATNDGGDELNGTSTPEEEPVDKNPQDVLVIPFGPTTGEFVGLLSEQKVCTCICCWCFGILYLAFSNTL